MPQRRTQKTYLLLIFSSLFLHAMRQILSHIRYLADNPRYFALNCRNSARNVLRSLVAISLFYEPPIREPYPSNGSIVLPFFKIGIYPRSFASALLKSLSSVIFCNCNLSAPSNPSSTGAPTPRPWTRPGSSGCRHHRRCSQASGGS